MRTSNPASVTITCDCCAQECTRANAAQHGHLHLKRDALDFQGVACADASVKLDLCDDCLRAISKAVNEAAVKIRGRRSLPAPAATADSTKDQEA